MDDARRLLRFVLPGTLFAVEFLGWIILLHLPSAGQLLLELKQESGVGAALGLLVASGGLGYLFSIIHHWCHWWRNKGTLDHRHLIYTLGVDNRLQVFRGAPP